METVKTVARQRLLISRAEAGKMLGGVSINLIHQLEDEGRLKPVRLGKGPTAMVFFRMKDVEEFVDNLTTEEKE